MEIIELKNSLCYPYISLEGKRAHKTWKNSKMNQEEEKKLLNTLKKEEAEILSDLSAFTQPDPHIEGGFKVPFPNEGTSSEETAREIEEFERLNALKNNLEQRLHDVRVAIIKIESGSYGQCEHCSGKIEATRLKVVPVASFCIKCSRQNSREA